MQIMSFTDQFHHFHLTLLVHSLPKISRAALNYYLLFTVLLSLSKPSSDHSQIWNYISLCPSFIKVICFSNKGSTDGTSSSKMCFMFVYVRFALYLCVD